MSTLPSPQAPSLTLPRPPRSRSKTRRLVVGTVLVVVALGILWTCGKGAYHNYRIASAAVDRFHHQLDQGDFETIYGEATDGFRGAGSRESALKFLETVHQKMGNSGKMSAKGFHIDWQNNVVSVNESFETQFTLGQAQERFTWIINHDEAHLQTYRIDSANLR